MGTQKAEVKQISVFITCTLMEKHFESHKVTL